MLSSQRIYNQPIMRIRICNHKWLKDFFEYIVLCSYKSSLWDSCP